MFVHGFPLIFIALVAVRIIFAATRTNRRSRTRADRLARRGYQPSGLGMPSGMPFPDQVPRDPYPAGQPFPGDPDVAGQPFPVPAVPGPVVSDQPIGSGFAATIAPDPVREDRGAAPLPTMPDPVQPNQTFSDPTFGGGFNSSTPTSF